MVGVGVCEGRRKWEGGYVAMGKGKWWRGEKMERHLTPCVGGGGGKGKGKGKERGGKGQGSTEEKNRRAGNFLLNFDPSFFFQQETPKEKLI